MTDTTKITVTFRHTGTRTWEVASPAELLRSVAAALADYPADYADVIAIAVGQPAEPQPAVELVPIKTRDLAVGDRVLLPLTVEREGTAPYLTLSAEHSGQKFYSDLFNEPGVGETTLYRAP